MDPDIKLHLNGTVTTNEDTADNGGINLAYRSYTEWLKSNPTQSRLIALEFTPKQLFWISYAQFYCTVQREESKRRLLKTYEVHSFDRYRVLGPLMNSQEFAQDFNCPLRSSMNPYRERCAIWWEILIYLTYVQEPFIIISDGKERLAINVTRWFSWNFPLPQLGCFVS